MTKNEYIASIMLEAADLLQESAGRKQNTFDKVGKITSKGSESLQKLYDKNTQKIKEWKKEHKNASAIKRTILEEKMKHAMTTNRNIKNFGKDADDVIDDIVKRVRRNKATNDDVRKNVLKEAIDLLYDKAANADTLDEATMYIDKAEQLESMIEE